MTEPLETSTLYTSLTGYAATHYAPGSEKPLSDRTVKRWLADDELPGAYQNERGHWMIPVNAERVPRTAGKVVAMTQRPVVSAVAHEAPAMTKDLPPELAAEYINRLPTFLTIPQAAYLLGVSEGTIRGKSNRRYFRVRKVDRHLMIPLARIKKLRGVAG